MTQLASHPSYVRIEDQLHLVGQKYRLQRMARGAILAGTAILASTWVAAGAVSVVSRDGQGAGSLGYLIAALWIAACAFAVVWWIVRPMMLRPRSLEVARLIESRLAGLHNGLTNAILLADREDVAANPWSPNIIDEIADLMKVAPAGIDLILCAGDSLAALPRTVSVEEA